jgi:hypothetical protein
LIILLAIPGEAKPVIIGFKGNVNSADIETYKIKALMQFLLISRNSLFAN